MIVLSVMSKCLPVQVIFNIPLAAFRDPVLIELIVSCILVPILLFLLFEDKSNYPTIQCVLYEYCIISLLNLVAKHNRALLIISDFIASVDSVVCTYHTERIVCISHLSITCVQIAYCCKDCLPSIFQRKIQNWPWGNICVTLLLTWCWFYVPLFKHRTFGESGQTKTVLFHRSTCTGNTSEHPKQKCQQGSRGRHCDGGWSQMITSQCSCYPIPYTLMKCVWLNNNILNIDISQLL